jgi:hypothetical protein
MFGKQLSDNSLSRTAEEGQKLIRRVSGAQELEAAGVVTLDEAQRRRVFFFSSQVELLHLPVTPMTVGINTCAVSFSYLKCLVFVFVGDMFPFSLLLSSFVFPFGASSTSDPTNYPQALP